jgi:hypothetical protein
MAGTERNLMEPDPVDELTTMLTVVVDDEPYTFDDLSYREQREMRQVVRDLVDNPQAELDEVAFMDYLPALYWVIKRRTDPEFSMDQALDLKPTQMRPEETEGNGKRPTERAVGAKK